jgi:hypothetical protein
MHRRKADNFELEGVRITNGRSQGAGILISTEDDSYAIIKDTLFNLNAGPRGGAISVANGNLILENVVIRDNYTASSGGGAIKFNESSDQENTNPLLRLLSNNGGPTMTMALLDVSPAIDAGLIAVCSQTDQRGYLRPIDGDAGGTPECDNGAFEFRNLPFKSSLPFLAR